MLWKDSLDFVEIIKNKQESSGVEAYASQEYRKTPYEADLEQRVNKILHSLNYSN